MKRTLVFLLLGPALVSLGVLMFVASIERIDSGFVAFCVMTSFLITMPVSVITGLMDGYLARGLPTLLRAPLTGTIGMAIAVGAVLAFFTAAFSPTVPPEVMNGALLAGVFLLLPMGLCSLLSSDYGNRQRPAGRTPDCEGRQPA